MAYLLSESQCLKHSRNSIRTSRARSAGGLPMPMRERCSHPAESNCAQPAFSARIRLSRIARCNPCPVSPPRSTPHASGRTPIDSWGGYRLVRTPGRRIDAVSTTCDSDGRATDVGGVGRRGFERELAVYQALFREQQAADRPVRGGDATSFRDRHTLARGARRILRNCLESIYQLWPAVRLRWGRMADGRWGEAHGDRRGRQSRAGGQRRESPALVDEYRDRGLQIVAFRPAEAIRVGCRRFPRGPSGGKLGRLLTTQPARTLLRRRARRRTATSVT